MKSKLIRLLTSLILLAAPAISFGQAPALGTAADFVLFTSNGAVSNTGISHITGNVGTNGGSSTAFGNVDGVMHDNDGASAACAADLLSAYNQLNATVPTSFPGILLGNGQTLNAGVFSIPAAATMNLDLILDGQGNPGAVFIFQIQGPFSANANSKVKLINGALACNVFWKIEGLVDMAAGTTMRGTIIANNAGINMNAGDTLEGRALSTSGAVTISGTRAYTPIGCGSAVLTGPVAPTLASIACYTIFSADGPVTNVGITYVTGDVGSNLGLTTGYNPLFVTGMIHPVPDGSTGTCATDLGNVYNYLNLLPYDIELLYPAQFGNNLVLTPHTYLLNSATTFTDTLFLDAEGNPNAVFVFKMNGALTTSVYSKVRLMNGAQPQNIFWDVEGSVSINDYSIFNGSIICNNGAINLNTGMSLNGRALSTVGAVNTSAISAIAAPGCPGLTSPAIIIPPATQSACIGDSVSFIVSATGTGLSYQWRRGSVNLIDGGNISGATTDTLTINPVGASDAGNNYNVIIYGTYSPNDTSANVSLVINAPPVITAQPVNQTACIGDSAGFSVTATGANLTYQWRKGLVNLINSGNISGATTAILSINPVTVTDVALNYNVVVSGACSPAATSNDASLLLTIAPVIILQPVNQTVCAGDSAGFTVAATGSGYTYQWRKGNINLVNGGNISGATNDTLVINPAAASDAALNYNVIVIASCAGNDTSVNVSLTVNAPPVITAQPVNQATCPGDSASFQVTATGTNLSYQWRKGLISLTNAGNISGVTTATLTINPVGASDAANNYNVVVSGTCFPGDTSVNASLIATNCLADLVIVKTVSDTTPVYGQNIVFTITVTNNGPASATGVEVSDVLQSGYTYVSSVTTTGTFIPATGIWTIGNMADSAVEVLTVTVTVIENGNYVNTAIVYGNETDPDLSDNNSSVETYPTDFHIPDGFSPNGDGVNDLFVIRGILHYPGNTFVIYNRWGNKVFEAAPYQNTWDGKSSEGLQVGGDQLPVGTYFYVLDLKDGTPVFKGTIYLNK